MSCAPPVEPFKGKDWEECNNFIRAIRARALWEGKQRDSAWIADFAAPQFSHKALSWHCQLPQDVQQDWFKLLIALLDCWPPPEDDDTPGPQIKPIPAAAPSLNSNGNADRPLQGALKVVFDEPNPSCYVSLGSKICNRGTQASEAIRIRCIFMSRGTLLERVDNTPHSWLAIEWFSRTPKIEKGSNESMRFCHGLTPTI